MPILIEKQKKESLKRTNFSVVKAWSADHCVDPRLVPGILFSSCAIDEPDPGLIDMAPTVLQLFGLPSEHYMEGRPLFHRDPFATRGQADGDPADDAR